VGQIVLVHGAWHGGWCWAKVAPSLQERGHRVAVSELHRGSLAADTAAVQEDVDSLGGDVVVCGHSYGGQVITGLRPAGLRRLVYLAALMPKEGETAFDLASLGPPSELNDALVFADDGTCTVDPGQVVSIFYADCRPEDQEAAVARLRPQVLATFTDPLATLAWRDVESIYIRCTEDRAIHPDTQDQLARRATKRLDWRTSHSPFLSRPELLVDLLDEAAS
jgi:pimeloyl-ACP methyl ester carboxylesterase